MLAKYNLENNNWLQKQFELREKWALVYGRQTFCADMSTTQRSESMNNQIKMYIGYKYDLLRFFHHFERLLADRRYEELKADFKKNQSKPSLPYPVKAKEAKIRVTINSSMFTRSNDPKLDIGSRYKTLLRWYSHLAARATMSEQSFDIAMSDGENTLRKVETTLKQLSIEDSLKIVVKTRFLKLTKLNKLRIMAKKLKESSVNPEEKEIDCRFDQKML
ncbi:hypothetical protein V6N12_020639 [Hibiscus sabdariffa]|uniref:Protein FAR1-RELATED SEQUENCE n=1 Tax=Hibiscus sabdariffa TaxID=183260 RepID=A0ABR2CYQ2_9ROSI